MLDSPPFKDTSCSYPPRRRSAGAVCDWLPPPRELIQRDSRLGPPPRAAHEPFERGLPDATGGQGGPRSGESLASLVFQSAPPGMASPPMRVPSRKDLSPCKLRKVMVTVGMPVGPPLGPRWAPVGPPLGRGPGFDTPYHEQRVSQGTDTTPCTPDCGVVSGCGVGSSGVHGLGYRPVRPLWAPGRHCCGFVGITSSGGGRPGLEMGCARGLYPHPTHPTTLDPIGSSPSFRQHEW